MLMETSVLKQRGSVMLESLIAILIFSMGILALVALLGASVRDTASAKYRTDASLLANQIIGQMWTGDKTNATLISDYGTGTDPGAATGAQYVAWKAKVVLALPGVVGATLPTIAIDANNAVTVTVFWQAPGESGSHNYVAITRIHD